jgi:hypothetical protein
MLFNLAFVNINMLFEKGVVDNIATFSCKVCLLEGNLFSKVPGPERDPGPQ